MERPLCVTQLFTLFLLVSLCFSAFRAQTIDDRHAAAPGEPTEKSDPAITERTSSSSRSLSDRLYLNFYPPTEAAKAIAPPSIMTAETPIVVRFTLMGGIGQYEPVAACHPTALSFFGTKDPIPPAMCNDDDTLAILQALTMLVAIELEFPMEAASYASFLRSLNIRLPSSYGANELANDSTIIGWSYIHGRRIANFFANDGWNSLGNWSSKINITPFEDYTGYEPVNNPYDDVRRLLYPLRWQPFRMTAMAGQYARFGHQIHVVPQLATRHVRPLVLSENDLQQRVAGIHPPYRTPNNRFRISAADIGLVRRLVALVVVTSARVTARQRAIARWWNNKLVSTAGISSYYTKKVSLTRYETAHQFLGEMLAQHDALLAAWRAKRHFDLARPRTLISRLYAGMHFRAFVDEQRGVQRVRADEWRPVIPEQPHSEFPSASSSLCTAAMEHMKLYVAAKRNLADEEVPALDLIVPAPFADPPLAVRYDTPRDAAVACGLSRLHAGVHFPPSISAGHELASGIGLAAFRHISQLERGIQPQHCWRCSRSAEQQQQQHP